VDQTPPCLALPHGFERRSEARRHALARPSAPLHRQSVHGQPPKDAQCITAGLGELVRIRLLNRGAEPGLERVARGVGARVEIESKT